jgi:hypothetical protein
LCARAAGRDSGRSARHRMDSGRVLAGAAYPGVALPLLVDPLLVDPASAVPLPTAPVFVVPPDVASAGVTPAGVTPAGVVVGGVLGATEEGGLVVGGAGVEELLPGAGEDGVTLGLAVPDGLVGDVEHGGSAALADVLPPFALAPAFVEAAELAVLVAVEVTLAGAVVLAVPVGVPVAVAPPPGLLLVLPLGGLLTEFSGDGLGAVDLVGAVVAEPDGELVTHPAAVAALEAADVPL